MMNIDELERAAIEAKLEFEHARNNLNYVLTKYIIAGASIDQVGKIDRVKAVNMYKDFHGCTFAEAWKHLKGRI